MEAILKATPKVSAEWHMRDKCDMFRTGEQHGNVTLADKPICAMGCDNNTYATLVEQLRKENASLQEQLREKGEQMKVKDEQIASLLAILSK